MRRSRGPLLRAAAGAVRSAAGGSSVSPACPPAFARTRGLVHAASLPSSLFPTARRRQVLHLQPALVPSVVFRRAFAADAAASHGAAEASEASTASGSAAPPRRVLHPPGAGASAGKAEVFARLVNQAVFEEAPSAAEAGGSGAEAEAQGGAVEIVAVGAPALWHSLRALCVGSAAADFEVAWHKVDAEKDSGRGEAQNAIRLLVRRGRPWKEFNNDFSGGYFVSKTTQTVQLAKKLAMELRQRKDGEVVTLHTYTDAEIAVAVMLKAIATVPTLGDFRPLRCTVSSVRRDGETVPRAVLHILQDPAPAVTSSEFVAYPLGAQAVADADAVKKFQQTVRHRIQMGETVVMQCRGLHATSSAMSALALVGDRVARFSVQWVDGDVPGRQPGEHAGDGPAPRALKVRARQGEPWEEFNSTNFSGSQLLRVSEGTQVKVLATKIGAATLRRRDVAVHVKSEDRASVFTAVKAIGSVPVEHPGVCVECVPSFGWTGDGAENRTRVLRLYIQRSKNPP